VPPGGDPAVQTLAEQIAEGKQTVNRIREGAGGPSPGLDGVADPLLDYLLGDGQ
jgi:hypothetical protein